MSRTMGTATDSELSGFTRLLDAVLGTPELVQEMVREHPELLECVNNSAETVLHWLAVENCVSEIGLLHKLGAVVPEFATLHALQAGNTETVDLLLALGANFGGANPLIVLRNPIWRLTPEKQAELIECLERHGYSA